MPTTPTDHERDAVVDAFRDGDDDALETIYRRYAALVYTVALRSLGAVTEAEDVTRRVFLTAGTRRVDYQPDRASLPVWLLGITRSTVEDAHHVRAGRRTPPAWGSPDPGEPVEQHVLAEQIATLDQVPQAVVRMALHEHLTHSQIAERLHLSPDAVKHHLGRSLLALRQGLVACTG